MPNLPSGSEVSSEGKNALADGIVYAVGTGIGEGAAGGIGHAVGGVVAGASIGGDRGQTLSTLAVANGVKRSFMGGGGGGGRGVK